MFHLVSLVELRIETGHLPLNNFYETSSLCAFLIGVLFLIYYAFYRVAIFGVCLFPVVFFMTLIGATEFPVATWSSPHIRNAWLSDPYHGRTGRLRRTAHRSRCLGLLPASGASIEAEASGPFLEPPAPARLLSTGSSPKP